MKINVNGLQWFVKFTDKFSDLNINGVRHLGVTDRNTLTIYLDDDLRGDLLVKVLDHELTHVWIFSHGYILTIEEEEFLCSFVDSYVRDIIEHSDSIMETNIYEHKDKTKR